MEWKNDILSFSGFDYGVAREMTEEASANKAKSYIHFDDEEELSLKEIKTAAEENEPKVSKDYEFDPMSERKIENFYFRNIEQAEKKMKKFTTLKAGLSDPGKNSDEIVAKAHLKPLSHENPWKNETFKQKETSSNTNEKKRGMCIIS